MLDKPLGYRPLGLAAAALAAAIVFSADSRPAQAFFLDGPSGKAPWCAETPGGVFDCSFYTFEQCRAFVVGVGQFCIRNTMATEELPPPPRRKRSRG